MCGHLSLVLHKQQVSLSLKTSFILYVIRLFGLLSSVKGLSDDSFLILQTDLCELSSEPDVVHPGVVCTIVFGDVDGKVLYVGKTCDPANRKQRRTHLIEEKTPGIPTYMIK